MINCLIIVHIIGAIITIVIHCRNGTTEQWNMLQNMEMDLDLQNRQMLYFKIAYYGKFN